VGSHHWLVGVLLMHRGNRMDFILVMLLSHTPPICLS
jgi:hypothetical protein